VSGVIAATSQPINASCQAPERRQVQRRFVFAQAEQLTTYVDVISTRQHDIEDDEASSPTGL